MEWNLKILCTILLDVIHYDVCPCLHIDFFTIKSSKNVVAYTLEWGCGRWQIGGKNVEYVSMLDLGYKNVEYAIFDPCVTPYMDSL